MMKTMVRTLIPVMAMLLTGCLDGSARTVAASVATDESTLKLNDGDRILGQYLGCAAHAVGEAWQLRVGTTSPTEALQSAWVMTGDITCQLLVTAIVRSVSGQYEQYDLVRPSDPTQAFPIQLAEDYNPSYAALARRASDGLPAFTVNVMGTGLDFTGASFGIRISTGAVLNEIGGVDVAAELDTSVSED